MFKKMRERRERRREEKRNKRQTLVKRIKTMVSSGWEHLEDDQRKYREREEYLAKKYRSNPR